MLKFGIVLCILVITSANFNPNKRHLLKDSSGTEPPAGLGDGHGLVPGGSLDHSEIPGVPLNYDGVPGRHSAHDPVHGGLRDDFVLNPASGALDGLVVAISDSFQSKDCQQILENIKVIFKKKIVSIFFHCKIKTIL